MSLFLEIIIIGCQNYYYYLLLKVCILWFGNVFNYIIIKLPRVLQRLLINVLFPLFSFLKIYFGYYISNEIAIKKLKIMHQYLFHISILF